MLNALARRGVEMAVVILVMSFVIYALIGLMPGDPIDLMISSNPHLTSADASRLRALYGLDRPIVERYGAWLDAAMHGDFGYSRTFQRPVLEVLLPRLDNTLLLMGTSFLLSIAIALPLGIFAALRPNSALDNLINLGCFAGISIPVFWLALMLIVLFAVRLEWFPAGGMGTVGSQDVADKLRYLALPVTTLTIASVGGFTRYMRSALIETMRQDYIRTARAKGAGLARIVLHHALQNALIPFVTVVALSFGSLFSGALVTETMFAYPGMGKLIYDSIMGNDFNLALVALLFATLLTLLGNLMADLAYAWLDPRISFAATRRGA